VERAVIESGLSYAIIRPTVIFGAEDILINNICWLLRRVPVFAVAGSGSYRIQPVFVEDVAAITVAAGRKENNTIIDAVGPDVFTFNELVRLIAGYVKSRAAVVHVPVWAMPMLSTLFGFFLRDIVLTRDELEGLMSGLLVSNSPSTGTTHLTGWLRANAEKLGRHYSSELDRHYR
jgi:NADH dehydrogenase